MRQRTEGDEEVAIGLLQMRKPATVSVLSKNRTGHRRFGVEGAPTRSCQELRDCLRGMSVTNEHQVVVEFPEGELGCISPSGVLYAGSRLLRGQKRAGRPLHSTDSEEGSIAHNAQHTLQC
jgi:hypothetical protein